MIVQEQVCLKDKHSFHLNVSARYWAEYQTTDELREVLQDKRFAKLPVLPLGGGCNLLFTQDFPGLIIKSAISSLEVVHENEEEVLLRAGSGLDWDQFVETCVSQAWGGIENLSGIPGLTGASPIQNIGAYGVEAKDVIQAVEVFDRQTLDILVLPVEECGLAYRNSRFKQEWKDRYIVCYISYRLNKKPAYRLDYGNLKEALISKGGLRQGPEAHHGNLALIRRAVLDIRSSKLPDPDVLGNAGSFFKNPELETAAFALLAERFPELPHWELPNNKVKLSAAWMIEYCGWKGKSSGRAGVYPKQALVLVNLGAARGEEIYGLYKQIAADVFSTFGIRLQAEVVIL
ncbi:MAG: UDP-N-acetylmuramate dehydrogenase [Bacteroidales bacterium]